MPEEVQPEPTAIPARETELLAGTERRISRAMGVLGVAGTILCSAGGGVEWGAGFAIGAALSAVNFRWMKAAINALADAAAGQSARPAEVQHIEGGGAESQGDAGAEQVVPAAPEPRRARGRGAGVAVRFVFRYALIGLAGYAIFISSLVSLGAFFLGLFLFIAAILAEVAYQIYGAFRSA